MARLHRKSGPRRSFIGGSDARIIMGTGEAALVRLWKQKRGEAEPEDLSGNLIVQLGTATEELNRTWYERNTGRPVRDVQRQVAFGHFLDGGHPRRNCGRHRGGLRVQVHAAVVLLRGGSGRKVHGPAAAQHVGSPTCTTRFSPSSREAANGSKSRFPCTHSTSAFSFRPKRNSGAACIRAKSPPHHGRAAASAHCGNPHRRPELVQLMGRVRRAVPQHAAAVSRP